MLSRFGVVRGIRGQVALLSLGSLNGASVCARAAVDALVSVDLVLAVSLVDSLGGAVLSASAAGDAIIANLVCHCRVLQIRICSQPPSKATVGLLIIISQNHIFSRGKQEFSLDF